MKLAKRDTKFGDYKTFEREAERLETQLAQHKKLEDEVKQLNSLVRATEQKRDELVETAQAKITSKQAQQVIVERLGKELLGCYQQYLKADQRSCTASIENLWSKYAVTAKQIETERDEAAKVLQKFLVELGYVD